MTFILLANFKSHKNQSEVTTWFNEVIPVASQHQDKLQLLVAPSFVHLSLIHPEDAFALCAQDSSPFPPGAYTGAVNATQLKDLGVTYSLVGHSERRHYFHETYQEISNKIVELISLGITPAICLSEADIDPQFSALDDNYRDRCIYCFEPPADIGGTVTAPPDLIIRSISKIHSFTQAPVLYGGSITPSNVSTLISLPLDGLLVASASLDPHNFNQIIENIAHEL